ncbi:MAG TPA: hypothetical protein DDY43_00720, partial [Synechococcales bacterium UBA10510]|nr:hypothetical protein [Synechococcales bacterium UBA10510]
MAQLLFSGSSLTTGSNLELALQLVENRLPAWASNSDTYNALLLEVFGVQSSEATGALQAGLSGTGLGIGLEILAGDVLSSINGAYTSAAPGGGERIYLNGAWLQNATAAEIEAVLLEEFGHALDWRLNGGADSPGDEGEIFSARLRGLTPKPTAFKEDDHRLISIAGTPVAIEAVQAPQISVTAIANGNEANGNPAVFRFSCTGSTTDALSVSYRLLGTAQAGSDYTGATSGTINFSAGSATAELSLAVLADSVIDPGETIIAQIVPDSAATPSYLITPGQQTAIATITAEGMVVAVNGPSRPGSSKGELRNFGAFAALKSDGTVVAWGDPSFGGTAPPTGLSGVTQIFSTGGAFAALKSDGTVVAWGSSSSGGTGVPTGLSGVTQIFSTANAFAALKSDGTVVAWGDFTNGGNAPTGLSGVTQIFSNARAFAALNSDGSVVSWGSPGNGGTAPTGLSGV